MSNPTNLTELAASLAAVAEMHRTIEMPKGENALAFTAYHMGARDALLDTRATVLAMIHEAEEAPLLERTGLHKATPRLQSTIADQTLVCTVCGKAIKHVPGGQGPTWVHEDTGMVVG